MKNTSKTRLWATLYVGILLTGIHTTIHAQDNDGIFARSWAWLKNTAASIGSQLKKPAPKRPNQRLAYKAAQLNSLFAPGISQDQKDIIIANIEQLRLLAQYGADGVAEAQYVLQALLLHGKQKPETLQQATHFYIEELAPKEHANFLHSQNGTGILAQLLLQAPPLLPRVSYSATKNTENALAQQVTGVARELERQLYQLQKQMALHEQNSELIKALQELENDTSFKEKQNHIEQLDQLLQEKAQDAELLKVLPEVQQKDKELEIQLMQLMQHPGLTPAQKEEKAQAILAEYEQFVTQYPAVKSYLDLAKQRMQAGQEAQEHLKNLTAQHPEIVQLAQLAQAQQEAVDGYNKCVEQLQAVPEAVKQLTQQRNVTLWCKQLQEWFAACKKALKEDDHPENHVLHYEPELKQYKAEWKALSKKWDELHEPIALQHERLTVGKEAFEYAHALEDIQRKPEEVKKRIALALTYRYKLPLNAKEDCHLLGITKSSDIRSITGRWSLEESKKLINESFKIAVAEDRANMAEKQEARTRLLHLVELDTDNHGAYQDMLYRYAQPELWQYMRKDNVPYFKQIIASAPAYAEALNATQKKEEQAVDDDYGYLHRLFPKSKQLIAEQISDTAIEYIAKLQKKGLKSEQKLSAIASQIALLQHEQSELKTNPEKTRKKLEKKITEQLGLPFDVAHDCAVLGIDDPILRKKIMQRTMAEQTKKAVGEFKPLALSTHTEAHFIYSDASHLKAENDVEEQGASRMRLINYLNMGGEQEEKYYELLAAYHNPEQRIETIKGTIADLQLQKDELQKQAAFVQKEQKLHSDTLQRNTFVKKYDPECQDVLHDTLQSKLTKRLKKLNKQIDETDILKASDCAVFQIKPHLLFTEKKEDKKNLLMLLKQKNRKFNLKYHPDRLSGEPEEEIEKAKEKFQSISGAYKRITNFLELDPETDFEKITRIKQLFVLKSKLEKQRKLSAINLELQKYKRQRLLDYQNNPTHYQTYSNVARHT